MQYRAQEASAPGQDDVLADEEIVLHEVSFSLAREPRHHFEGLVAGSDLFHPDLGIADVYRTTGRSCHGRLRYSRQLRSPMTSSVIILMVKSMRVAITLEQSWHRVPGGTAVAALETARAIRDEPEM